MPIKRNILLNPGPATTTDKVKMAQVVPDICPREDEFVQIMSGIRKDLLKVVNGNNKEYSTVLISGSGTAAMESSIASVVNKEKTLLILINGAYGDRMQDIAKAYSLPFKTIEYNYGESINFDEVKIFINNNSDIGYLAMVHHETTTGILNSITSFSKLGKKFNLTLILDAISSYAGLQIDLKKTPIDYLISTSNKCLQGMAGLAFVICNQQKLSSLKNVPKRSYYLDLYDSYQMAKKSNQMRFTPPVQVIYALRTAIDEFFVEGMKNRYKRYQSNMQLLRTRLNDLGFEFLLNAKDESNILLSIQEPTDMQFSFQEMHDFLYSNGITIYPGKILNKKTFRLAIIGDLHKSDIEKTILLIEKYLQKKKLINNLYTRSSI